MTTATLRPTKRKNFTIPRDCIRNPHEIPMDSTPIGLCVDQVLKGCLEWDDWEMLASDEADLVKLQGFIFDGLTPTEFAVKGMRICKNERYKNETRERKIVEHFAAYGYKLKFTGNYDD